MEGDKRRSNQGDKRAQRRHIHRDRLLFYFPADQSCLPGDIPAATASGSYRVASFFAPWQLSPIQQADYLRNARNFRHALCTLPGKGAIIHP
uniref:hypothetical protein n=1 Tax=Candidatus Fimivicinus sp. TaxID=3056640 RepID=UPI003FEFBCCC